MPTQKGTKCPQGAGWGTPRSWGPCKYHTDEEPNFTPDQLPEPIPQEASGIYLQLLYHLQELEVYNPSDQYLIVALVLNVLKMREAYSKIQEEGWTEYDQSNQRVRKHPAVKFMREATSDIKKISNSLGLSPNARSQIKMPGEDDEDEETSTMEKLLRDTASQS